MVSTLSVVSRPGPRRPSGNGHAPTAGNHPVLIDRLGQRQQALLRQVAEEVQGHNVPYYGEVRVASRVAEGIIQEVAESGNVRLLLMGWPGPMELGTLRENPVAEVLAEARCDVAVFLNRDIGSMRRILMPFGGGVHSRLALRLASQLAEEARAQLVVLRCLCDPPAGAGDSRTEEMHDELLLVREELEALFGRVPPHVSMRVARSESVPEGVLQELAEHPYDLVVMGAAVASTLQTDLFGSMTDSIAEQIPCSVLLVRHHEPVVVNWVRRRVKQAIVTQ